MNMRGEGGKGGEGSEGGGGGNMILGEGREDFGHLANKQRGGGEGGRGGRGG